MKRQTITERLLRFSTVAVAALAGAACSDVFDVDNPGQILDEDLNSVQGVTALVVGMSAAFSEGYDDQSFLVARGTDEMAGSGSYTTTGFFRRGIIDEEDTDGFWEDAQEARWVAEAGLERMRAIEGFAFDGNSLTARAYLLAGFSNRWLGENFCQVTYSAPYEGDDGTLQPRSAAFSRGLMHFQQAVTQSTQSGDDDIRVAALAGQAQMYVGLGDWTNAVAFANQIPTDFVYEAVFSDNSGSEQNEIFDETHRRHEMSAFATLAGNFVTDEATAETGGIPQDVRAPFTNCYETGATCAARVGADGLTPHFRQEKYSALGANIPLAKGTEMRLIEAEAVLQPTGTGDIAEFLGFINDARDFYGLAPIAEASVTGIGGVDDADDMDAWSILDRERHLTLWLEGRRLFDLDRWNHPFLMGGTVVYPGIADRFRCLPISFSECQTNPNVPCSTG